MTCPEGREVIRGKIISVKHTEKTYTHLAHEEHFVDKMTVQDERGFKVYGTAPRCLKGELKGRIVSFNCILAQSPGDPLFGFFRNPTKAVFLDPTLFEEMR
jgi:hypothetical protein